MGSTTAKALRYQIKPNQIYLRQKKNMMQHKKQSKYVDRTQRQYELGKGEGKGTGRGGEGSPHFLLTTLTTE